MALYDEKDAISMRRDTAETIRYLCTEGHADVDTVIRDLIEMAGGADVASVAIYHRHNAPVNDDPSKIENHLRDMVLSHATMPYPDE